jgi:hypothetical protein
MGAPCAPPDGSGVDLAPHGDLAAGHHPTRRSGAENTSYSTADTFMGTQFLETPTKNQRNSRLQLSKGEKMCDREKYLFLTLHRATLDASVQAEEDLQRSSRYYFRQFSVRPLSSMAAPPRRILSLSSREAVKRMKQAI